MVFLAGTALASPPGAYPDRQEVLHEVDHPRTPEDRPVWREWRTTEPDGIAYSQFTASYRSFVQQQRSHLLPMPHQRLLATWVRRSLVTRRL